MRWTLVFSAFFAFAGGVVASRVAIGPPLIALGLIGVLLQTERVRFGPVPTVLSIWALWGGIGYFATSYPDSVWDALVQLAKLCVISFVGVNALRTTSQVRAYCAFIVVAYLLYPGRGSFLNWITGANVIVGGRVIWNGVYGNPNDLAGITLLIISTALAFFAVERDRRLRLASLAAAGFMAFIVFVTQSRGALVALGVFVIAAMFKMPRQYRLRATLAVAAMGVVLAAFAPSSVWERLSGLRNVTNTEDLTQVDGSADQRYEIWKVARTIIAEHPLTGVGLGAYSEEHGVVATRPQFRTTARGKRDTHSMYFNVMAETGIPGFIIFSLAIVLTVRKVDRVRRRLTSASPSAALQLQFLELGMLAYCVAAIWGSYAKLNMLYLHMTLMWVAAKAHEREELMVPQPVQAQRR